MQPAVFIDRDGVINRNPPNYVKTWEEFLFLPEALTALSQMALLPWPIVIITNQSVVGRGIIALETLNVIHSRMVGEIQQAGGRINGIFVCPHSPEEGCQCRKPEPGLILRASKELDLNLSQSVLVGDSCSDILASLRAGVQPVYRVSEDFKWTQSNDVNSDRKVHVPVVKDLLEFSKVLAMTTSEGKSPADMIYFLAARTSIDAI